MTRGSRRMNFDVSFRCFTLWLTLVYSNSIMNTGTVKLWMVTGHALHKQINKS